MSLHIRAAFVGVCMGFVLSRLGFSSFGEVHNMFTFSDFRLLLAFAGGVALTAAGFAVLLRKQPAPKRPLHAGVIPGGILFGIGWALTGACPSIALVQIGEGYVPAVMTGFGVAVGTWLYRKVHLRYFLWEMGSCGDW